jgi:hypothetical protein
MIGLAVAADPVPLLRTSTQVGSSPARPTTSPAIAWPRSLATGAMLNGLQTDLEFKREVARIIAY